MKKIIDEKEALEIARHLVEGPSLRKSWPAGYDIKKGEKALIVVNNLYDRLVVDSIVEAIREKGARADVIIEDVGYDRQLEPIDELRLFIHNWDGVEENNQVRNCIERSQWVEKVAEDQGYNILIHTLGGPLPENNSFRCEGIPWFSREIFPAATYPYELWSLIDKKAWDLFWEKGKGGKVRITDPEGTDLSFTLFEEYFDEERYTKTNSVPLFTKKPFMGHLLAHPTPPFLEKDDTTGVIAGTTNHIGRPFPNARAYLEKGKVIKVEGGGEYGELWREILKRTNSIKYPEHPENGLFYLWETAIGTHPKIIRPQKAFRLAGAGTIYEKSRSGIIHMGMGTFASGPSELWAIEHGYPCGHLHIHLFFATYEITTSTGEKINLIKNGRLTVLDDPEVRSVAAKYGDPDDLLKEEWIPQIPGITAPGNYWEDYANDPAKYYYGD